jgi:hypothetical protein
MKMDGQPVEDVSHAHNHDVWLQQVLLLVLLMKWE